MTIPDFVIEHLKQATRREAAGRGAAMYEDVMTRYLELLAANPDLGVRRAFDTAYREAQAALQADTANEEDKAA